MPKKPKRRPVIRENAPEPLKDLVFLGGSEKDLKGLPDEVQDVFLAAIALAREGLKHPDAKPLKGYGVAGVLEVVETHDGNAYREIYTIQHKGVVYILHVFQKKSASGIGMDKQDQRTLDARIRAAAVHYQTQTKQ